MAAIKISNLDSDDFNLLSPLTDKEAETIQGGLLPSQPGSGSRKPPRPALYYPPFGSPPPRLFGF